jgi:hypothetical protein
MGHFLFSIDYFYFIKSIDWGRKTSVNTKNFFIYYSCQRKIIENFCAISPNIYWTIFSKAFIIKAINLSDLAWLMISSQDSNTVLVSHFQTYQQGYSLDRVIATINIVTHKEVICVRSLST